MKKILLSFFVMVGLINVQAQNLYEALRYSQTHTGGTARGLGAGSAFGALGGDYTSAGINPGGLGVFRKSEFFLTLNLNNTVSESNFGGNIEQHKLNFHPASYGMVFSKQFVDKRGNRSRGNWTGVNFGFGMTRNANFNTKRYYANDVNAQSILPVFAGELSGQIPNNINYGTASFESVLAYAAYLVNPNYNDSTNYNSVTDGEIIGKQVSVNTSGRMDEMTFAVAANYNDKIYFGGALGIPIISYTENVLYAEYDKNNDAAAFNSFEMEKYLRTSGAGVNLKLGAQFRVNDWVRFGAAFHTPSYIGLKDRYFVSVVSDLTDSTGYSAESPDGSFKYKLLTPWKGIASMAILFKQYGFLSVDYEYADYRNSRYSFANEYQSYETSLNSSINTGLNNTHTIRAGAEAAIKNFRLRGGYNISTSPLSASLKNAVPEDNRLFQSFSAGAGYRGDHFSFDFAFIRSMTDNSVMLANTIVSADRISRNNFVMTFGLRF
jgi:hypothetical protein